MAKKKSPDVDVAGSRTSTDRTELLFAVAVLVAASLLAYGNSFRGAFQFDDIALERKIYEPTWANFVRLLFQTRAVVDATFFFNRLLTGEAAFGYHLVNFAIHLGAAFALLGILRRTPGAKALALPAALIFLVHPLQTESVTYIVQRAQSLMGLLELVSFYCVARSQTEQHRGRWQAMAVVAFALGMLTKPHLLLLPVLVLLYERAFFTASFAETIRRSRTLYYPVFVAWAVTALYLAYKLARVGWSDIGAGGRTPFGYAASQLFVIPYYVWLSVFPRTLCIDYGWNALPVWQVGLGAVATLALVAATVVAWRRSRPLGFVGAWFFLNLAPVSSFIPRVDLVVEHRMYVPLISVILVGLLVGQLLPRKVALAALGLVVLVLAARTRARNEDYASPVALWTQTVAVAPENPRAYHNLGTAFSKANDTAGAMKSYTRALEVDPLYYNSYNDRGDLKTRLNLHAEAIADYTSASQSAVLAPMAFYNRGNAHGALGHTKEQIADYSRAIEVRKGFLEALYNRGLAYQEVGDHEKAVEDFTAAIEVKPNFGSAFTNRGVSKSKLGRRPAARADFERAIELEPTRSEPYFARAIIAAEENRMDAAWADVRKGRSLKGTPPADFLDWLRKTTGRSE